MQTTPTSTTATAPTTAERATEIARLRQCIAELADAATAQKLDGLCRLEWIRQRAFAALDGRAA